jgi:hypothetical protein
VGEEAMTKNKYRFDSKRFCKRWSGRYKLSNGKDPFVLLGAEIAERDDLIQTLIKWYHPRLIADNMDGDILARAMEELILMYRGKPE